MPIADTEAIVRFTSKSKVIQFSLRTSVQSEIKARHAVALAHVEAFWASLRAGPSRLTQKQVVALAGEIYGEFVRSFEDDPGDVGRWEWNARAFEAAAVPDKFISDSSSGTGMAIVDRTLARYGLVIDTDSVDRLFAELRRALREAAERLKANAQSDYSPDLKAARFPLFEASADRTMAYPTSRSDSAISLTGLVEDWWVERKAAGTAESTFVNYRGTVRKFVAFLGHDDALRVTGHDVVRFKDHRLASGISARTVKDQDLAGLKSVLGWAKGNLKLPTNAAESITIKRGKTERTRPKWFESDEAIALLRGAQWVERGNDSEKVWLAKRWVPWLLAYTGARVGEVVQLRKRDLYRADGYWEIDITPEAGTVKSGNNRRVPLHPHLVDLGFPQWVQGREDGHLFVDPNPKTGDVLGPLQGVKNRVTEFAREHVPDKRVAPNHGWRHLFVWNARHVGMDLELRGMILGQVGQTVAAREYGGPAGLYREICKLPRFEV